jgi:hypothetical protein
MNLPSPTLEHLSQQSFAAADPVPHLLQLLQDHPTYPIVHPLAVYYTDAV